MNIPFSSRSKFLTPCIREIESHGGQLDAGESLVVSLESGGYAGNVIITISPDDEDYFSTDWRNNDPTRFPARIRAAATALFRARCFGTFAIALNDGRIEIRAATVFKSAPKAETDSATVHFVSCVSQKRRQRSPARGLYTSTWFCKARAFVEAANSPWFILSAKYGLVDPAEMINPYELTLNCMSAGDRRKWATRGLMQFDELDNDDVETVSFLAGQRYREFLVDKLVNRGIEVQIPMRDLKIGEQLQWLSQHTVR